MMYPKKEANSLKSTGTASRRFLNPSQRDELKKVVAERLAKKYGLKYTDLIKDEVNNYINQNKNITAAGLQDLENKVLKATQPKYGGRGNVNDNQDDDNQSVKSGISKMSGASNFDEVDTYTKKTLTKQEAEEQEKYKDKKLQTMNITTQKNDLDFLDEENEWAAIYKYNKHLYDKEQQIIQQKLREQKIKTRMDLDAQIVEKQQKKFQEKQFDARYAENMQIQMNRFDVKEREKQEELEQLKVLEKEARQRQIKENKFKRRHEEKQQKALDQYLMQKVRQELEQEQNYQQFKKEHQAQVMKKLLEENEERKKVQKENDDDERQENIRLMNAYAKLIQDQEEERDRNLKERDIKMKEFQAKALEQVAQDFEDKLGKMEARRNKYEKRYEQKLDEEEERKKLQIAQNKKDMKQYLFKQMDERDQRKKDEKREFNSQADIWKNDNTEYQEFENLRNEKRKDIMTNYASTLKQQMQDNKEQKKQLASRMNENEAFINKYLLEELDRLRQAESTVE